MPDHAEPGLPRIALVFGDEAAAAHVRDAVQVHVDIVYATSAAAFDATRMAAANVVAALVNLDDSEWLDAFEAKLEATNVPMVYNDPEISRGLQGWERARWLRHLLAKLQGSTDVDPPRPSPAGRPAGNPPAAFDDSRVPVSHEPGVFERPLSPQEIETMTADFVGVQETAGAQTGAVAQPAVADAPIDTVAPRALPEVATAIQPGSGVDNTDDLDVDTETLSAMIDARLADAESRSPSNSQEVWRLVEGGATPPVAPVADAETASGAAVADVDNASPPRALAGTAPDEAEVTASLPSLDDWQLVDPEAEPAPVADRVHQRNPEPALPESLAGLALEPMETISAVLHTEPIERWLHESESRKSAKVGSAAESEPVGDKA